MILYLQVVGRPFDDEQVLRILSELEATALPMSEKDNKRQNGIYPQLKIGQSEVCALPMRRCIRAVWQT